MSPLESPVARTSFLLKLYLFEENPVLSKLVIEFYIYLTNVIDEIFFAVHIWE